MNQRSEQIQRDTPAFSLASHCQFVRRATKPAHISDNAWWSWSRRIN